MISARMRRRAVINSMALANQIVQVRTEAKASPTITALTTTAAAMNMPQGDRSRGNFSATSGEGAVGVVLCSTAGAGLEGAGATCGAATGGGSAAVGEPGVA